MTTDTTTHRRRSRVVAAILVGLALVAGLITITVTRDTPAQAASYPRVTNTGHYDMYIGYGWKPPKVAREVRLRAGGGYTTSLPAFDSYKTWSCARVTGVTGGYTLRPTYGAWKQLPREYRGGGKIYTYKC